MKDFGQKTFYSTVLDHKPGFFLSWFLYRLFQKVRIDENMKEDLRQMNRKGTVVYAVKYRGQLDYLLYHYNFRKKRLPYPKIAFDLDISLFLPFTKLMKVLASQVSSLFRYGRLPNPFQSGFYKNTIQKGTASLIFLVDPKGFIRHFIHAEQDHIQFLLEIQKEMERSIFIVPQLILYKKTPEKDYTNLSHIFFGLKDKPGFIRKIVLFLRNYQRAVIDFGRPLDLKAYLENQPPTRPFDDMAVEIRQMLIESIDVQKRVVLGPIMKSRQQLKEIVLMDPKVTKTIESAASGDPKRVRHLRKKAGEYFDEIAADYNVSYIELFSLALNWLWNKIFDGIDVDSAGSATLREWARRGPMIYVPSHKSHIDYLILNYVLFHSHMHVPRIAAGKNLTFWPMGYIFRKSGAFFMRRSFKGAKLYVEVFTRYIKVLLEEGHPIEFFIEGGRSRDGKLVLPKTGFLSIILQAYEEGFCNDLIFVPTSINYDRILEEKSYQKEIGGERKEQENLWQVVKARQFLKKRYGKIYVRFNTPFSLKEHLSQITPSAKNIQRDLAFHLVKSINSVSIVTPLSLIATAILTNHRRGFHLAELAETVDIILQFLNRYKAPMASTLNEPSTMVENTLSLLTNWNVVDFLEDAEVEEETFYYVDDEKKIELEYYKNSIIHFFIHHSFVAISVLTGQEEVKKIDSILSDYDFLKALFKHEFVFDEDIDSREQINSIIDYFVESGFLTRSIENGGLKITKRGFDRLPIWAALTKTFLESYWIVVKSMSQQKSKEGKTGDLLKKMNYLGKRFHKLGVIDHIGALSSLNYKNALNFINKEILSNHDNPDEENVSPHDRLAQFGQRLYELSHYGQ